MFIIGNIDWHIQADPKYGLALTAEFFSNGYRVGLLIYRNVYVNW